MELMQRKAARTDFLLFAREYLKIRPKGGGPSIPLVLNRAQRHLHDAIEAQLRDTGKVRALVLKGRQQGVSTYTEARLYWRVTTTPGKRAYILSHEQDSTNNLFGMVQRYHDENPIAPATVAANARELEFRDLGSGYRVATAGSRAVGRSQTVQYFHGSEVAFWPNAEEHKAGVLQAIPNADGTEVILESTANGVGGVFHQMWQEAEAGLSSYLPVFIPWYWQTEYRIPIPGDFRLTEEEEAYKAAYHLDDEQVAWRRSKTLELGGPVLFKQEYPANAAEAFQVSGEDRFIQPSDVLAARKRECRPEGKLVIGADPARFGDDRFSVAYRQGRKVSKIVSRGNLSVVEGAGWLKQIIDRDKPARVFIDLGGIGAGTHDILMDWGRPYSDVVRGVNFGGSPLEPEIIMEDGSTRPGPLNRRAEMWMRSRDWLTQEGGADIPDTDAIQADACGPSYKYDMKQRVVLESKEQMRKRGIRSPDEWDAVALTFAEPVGEEIDHSDVQVDVSWVA